MRDLGVAVGSVSERLLEAIGRFGKVQGDIPTAVRTLERDNGHLAVVEGLFKDIDHAACITFGSRSPSL